MSTNSFLYHVDKFTNEGIGGREEVVGKICEKSEGAKPRLHIETDI